MKASKGFLLVEVAVVFFIVGTLLFFVIKSFTACLKSMTFTKEVRQAQILAEQALTGEVEASERWQVEKVERKWQGVSLMEVQVLEKKSNKVIYNLLWGQ